MEFSVNKSYYYYLMFSQLHSLILVLGSCKIPTLACGIDLGFLKGQDALEISSAGWKRTAGWKDSTGENRGFREGVPEHP